MAVSRSNFFGPKSKAAALRKIESLKRILAAGELLVKELVPLEDDNEGEESEWDERKIVADVFERLGDCCKRTCYVIGISPIDKPKEVEDLMVEAVNRKKADPVV